MLSQEKTKDDRCTLFKTQLFKPDLYQNDVLGSSWEKVNRKDSGIGSTSLQFEIKGTDQYIDLASTILELDLTITKRDGTNLDADAEIALLNLPGSSIFKQLRISVKNKPILAQQNYDLGSLLQTELTYGKEAKNNWLAAMSAYFKDTASQHNTLGDANVGFLKRKNLTKDSKNVTIMTQIYNELFTQPKYFLNHCNLGVEFDLQTKEKCIMYAANADVKLNINKAILHVKKINLSPERDLKIQNKLLKKKAVYDISRYVIFTKTFAAGIQSAHLNNFNIGDELPTKMIVVLTDEAAFTGTSTQNPFNFKHYNLSSFNILVNSRSIYGEAIECDFGNQSYLDIFWRSMDALGHINGDGCDISYEDYNNGYAVFAADLTPSQCAGDMYTDPIQTGALEIKLDFRAPLPNVITVQVYCEYENHLFIDGNRDVTKDFIN